MTVREVYEKNVCQLPAMDRLRLASLILDDLAASSGAGLDIRDEWSDEDLADLTKYSVNVAEQSEPAEDA